MAQAQQQDSKQETGQRRETTPRAQPSEKKEDNPVTDGGGKQGVRSETPENKEATINPSSPGNTGTTPGTNAENG